MIDDDERAALERELAAELVDLNLDDVNDYFNAADSSECETISVAHRDLDDILRQVGHQHQIEQEKQSRGSDGKLSAWELLLQSVDQSDREFFGAMNAEIDDIRATLLTSESDTDEQNKADELDAMGQDGSHEAVLQFVTVTNNQAEANDGASSNDSGEEKTRQQPATEAKSLMKSGGIEFEADSASSNNSLYLGQPSDLKDGQADPPHQSFSSDTTSIGTGDPSSSEAAALTIHTPSQQTIMPTSASPPQSTAIDSDPALMQHGSAAWPRLAQQRWETQQQEAAQWLSQLELDVKRLNAEQERRECERSEAAERSLMDHEERRSRQHIERLLELRFQEEMQVEDAISLMFNSHLRREMHCEQANRNAMEKEDEASDAAERWFKQVATERRLLQEKNLMRRLFNSVLISMVEAHRVKQADEQKRLELEQRRQSRENSLMRAEEAQTRRWIAQMKAIALERERLSNRMAMMVEDELAHGLERLGRRNHATELRNCQEMRDHDLYSARAWQFALEEAARRHQEAERHRLERARTIERAEVTLRAMHHRQHLRYALKTWIQSTRDVLEREEQAIRLQRWWREILNSQLEPAEDEDEWSEVAADAAMVVQSAFRGFFVRRRFQAALDLAREVGDGVDDAGFDEVNLNDLIEMPPELADGWEDPVLPRVFKRIPIVQVDHRGSDRDADDGNDDDEERDDEVGDEHDAVKTYRNNNAEDVSVVAAAPAVKEPNLAASLWSKMMRSKQKQRRAVEERVKQQDPTYRVQKLLQPKRGGKQPRHQGGPISAAAAGAANADKVQAAPTITWTTSSNPPKPKVKLPSLVERLRKKTAAERASG